MQPELEASASSWQGGNSRRRATIAALLLTVAVFGLTWALLVPPWQSPDEPQHFAYAQSLAERGALPGNKNRLPFSSAQTLADSSVGASREAFYPGAVPPDWNRSDYQRYLNQLRAKPSASNGGGPNSAASNPPLYYLYSDLAYLTTGGGSNSFDELYAMRIWDLPLLLITALAAWLLAGEVFGPRAPAQLACAAVAGLLPAETFLSTSVNPDALMIALWSVALWLGARVIVRRGPGRESLALALITAGAVLTKATSYALVPAVLLALFLGWRLRGPERRSAFGQFAAPVAALAAPVLGWIALATALGRPAVNTIQSTASARPFNLRQFISYVWQFYLPRLPFLTRFRETPGLPLYDYWIREGWGVFGWRDVAMPAWIYGVFAAISALVALVSVAFLALIRDRVRLALLAFFGLALIALLVGLHVTDYRAIIAGQAAVIQGRYLLPVLPLFGLAVGLLVSHTPRRWRGQFVGAVLAGLMLLQVLALGTVLGTYYT
jgi:4-amino-4-deoxy-L-arabinose transferase-like glycosyltransferase